MADGKLAVSAQELNSLISDLDAMERHLKKKIERLNTIVATIDAGWRSSAGSAYKDLQRGVNEDAIRIRQMLILLEEAMKMSRDGFTDQELEVMRSFRQLQQSEIGRQRILGMADDNPEPPGAAPRSRLDEFH
ncbi:WXG100 family type VII secretion target [Streptomyces sp. URMC 123]|uniref:WXG100 family type VII secretion target n=1 Tax=Streptomyces sp. URMC 123 TaxID=3423403 RepID=UPI003F1BEDD6